MKRNFVPAAQGVRRWYRTINGRSTMFTLVERGWWGVGPTGRVTVSRAISNGDYYPVRRYQF